MASRIFVYRYQRRGSEKSGEGKSLLWSITTHLKTYRW